MAYHYRLRSTGASSDRFGPCEVCGKRASEIFIQAEMRDIETADCVDRMYATGNGRTYAGCRPHVFGHEECLKSRQR
jgi:hypothetical protein